MEYFFRFCMYAFFGLSLETIFAVTGISTALGFPVDKRVPKKYLEGFVSLYMIPIHGLGVLFGFENLYHLISGFPFYIRFIIWCLTITGVEALTGWLYDKILGFYPWDYYSKSKYRIFKRGYTLWTLVPLWGIAGLILEKYVDIMLFISPHLGQIIKG